MFAGDDWSDNWNYAPTVPWGQGSGSGSIEEERTIVDDLHDVVREVTGRPVEKPEPRKIGFY